MHVEFRTCKLLWMRFVHDGSRWSDPGLVSLSFSSLHFMKRPPSVRVSPSCCFTQWVPTRGRFRKYQLPLSPPLFQGKLTNIPCASINRKLSDECMHFHIRTCRAVRALCCHGLFMCTEKFTYTGTLETRGGSYTLDVINLLQRESVYVRDSLGWLALLAGKKKPASTGCYWYRLHLQTWSCFNWYFGFVAWWLILLIAVI